MTFNELDARMRAFETRDEARVPDAPWLVARLDGRGFTRLTKREVDFEKPFDARFHQAMKQTMAHLFDCGFTFGFGFSQSDEISLLFAPESVPFERKSRKILSVLAGEASARFSLALGVHGAFDCRLSALPDRETARDYFTWRALDATRNALSAHCYWITRGEGLTARAATRRFDGFSSRDKRAFLGEYGVDFNTLPRWQTRGFAAWFESYQKPAFNPQTGESVVATRKRLIFDVELPDAADFARYLNEKLG